MHFLQSINSDISVLIVCNKTGVTIKGDIKKLANAAPRLIAANLAYDTKTKLNSVALVRERTIQTELPSPVGEVSANFCG